MSLTPSLMIPLGTQAPDFELPDVVTGRKITLASFKSEKALLVMFICRHCPYVQHVKRELAKIGRDYLHKGLAMVAISSNDAKNYPEDASNSLKELAEIEKFKFPLCYDETQSVAKKYSATCTPDFFLFDAKRSLAYRGQLDDSRPDSGKPVTGKDLRAAIDAVLAGKKANEAQRPSMGCNIKWKPGNEPDYFK